MTLILSNDDVEKLLTMPECIDVLEEAYVELEDMQVVARMADKAGLSMPIAGAIKELVKDGRRIKQSNPPDWTGRKAK